MREKKVIDFANGKTRLFATKNHCPDPDATFRDIVTGRYFLELIMNLMILSRQFIDVIVSYRKSQ